MKPQLTIQEKVSRLELKVAIAGAIFRREFSGAKEKIAEQNAVLARVVGTMQELVKEYLRGIENERLHLQFKRAQRRMWGRSEAQTQRACAGRR